MPVDYRVWDHIDVSDDEDDLLPHIEKASLFRWRHQARLEKMAEAKREKQELKEQLNEYRTKIAENESKLAKGDLKEDEKDLLQAELKEIEKQQSETLSKYEELTRKSRPWNVDTIAHESFSKSRVNSAEHCERMKRLTEEESSGYRFQKFYDSNKSLIKKFGMLSKLEDSKQFLLENRHLCCEETLNGLVLQCLDYEMEGKHKLMEFVARQTILFQYMIELSTEICSNPHSQSFITSFYTKFPLADKSYLDTFEEEVNSFKDRIRARAVVKLAEAKEKERQKRLGPGGLDPVEVFDSLPDEMKECFKQRDTQMLENVALAMDVDQFEYHIKRCIDAGLWVANKNEIEETNEETVADNNKQENNDTVTNT